MQFGLKLGSVNLSYTNDIADLFDRGVFSYIELFAVPRSYESSIEYWRQFRIPFVIHAPHSMAGMNLSLKAAREKNLPLLEETFRFAEDLRAEHIVFHAGVDGTAEEAAFQLKPFVDLRCLIENKPKKGLNGEHCVGVEQSELNGIMAELGCGFCLDFGHAICAANSLKREPFEFIDELLKLKPALFHLTDGDFSGELDSHEHYGHGSYPMERLFALLPPDAMVTNEAKHVDSVRLQSFSGDSRIFNAFTQKDN